MLFNKIGSTINWRHRIRISGASISIAILTALLSQTAIAADASLDVAGFVENVSYARDGRGLSKARNTLQIEISKAFKNTGRFTDVGLHATFRGSYDAVYDLNEDEFGATAGSAIFLEQVGVPANAVFPGAPAFPAANVAHGSGIVRFVRFGRFQFGRLVRFDRFRFKLGQVEE